MSYEEHTMLSIHHYNRGQNASILPFDTLQLSLFLIFSPWQLLHAIPLYNCDILNTHILK